MRRIEFEEENRTCLWLALHHEDVVLASWLVVEQSRA
jgi:hypothetical protein